MTLEELKESLADAPPDVVLGKSYPFSFYEEHFREHIDYARELFGTENVFTSTYDCDTMFGLAVCLHTGERKKYRALKLWDLDGILDCPFSTFKEMMDDWKNETSNLPVVTGDRAPSGG